MSLNATTEHDREALRRQRGLRLVSADQEGSAARDLPSGLYGFTSSPALASPLFSARRFRNFEVHRLSDGPAVVGFVTAADAAKLSDGATGAVEIQLFPDREGEATWIVSIPYDRIVQHRQYSIRNAEAAILHVLPAAVDLVRS